MEPKNNQSDVGFSPDEERLIEEAMRRMHLTNKPCELRDAFITEIGNMLEKIRCVGDLSDRSDLIKEYDSLTELFKLQLEKDPYCSEALLRATLRRCQVLYEASLLNRKVQDGIRERVWQAWNQEYQGRRSFPIPRDPDDIWHKDDE